MSPTILLVDDQKVILDFLSRVLEEENYQIITSESGEEALDLYKRYHPDLTLLDIRLPDKNGIDVLKIIHEKKIETPVIVLSGVNDVDLAVRALKLGAFDYLTKPVDDDYLLEVIDKAIEHRTLHEDIRQLPEELSWEDLAFEEAFARLPTQNPEMIHLLHRVEKIATPFS